LKAVAENKLAKEAIPEVLRALAENPESSVEDVIEKLSLRGLTLQELERLVDEIISERKQLIMEKKEKAFSPIMGIVMEKVRGKIDGKIVAEVVRKKITEAISS
ncbi:MAG: GatB/YqeY domain-containing protein, partial [Infirmifilum sp.]